MAPAALPSLIIIMIIIIDVVVIIIIISNSILLLDYFSLTLPILFCSVLKKVRLLCCYYC